jgi:hypothetical protein
MEPRAQATGIHAWSGVLEYAPIHSNIAVAGALASIATNATVLRSRWNCERTRSEYTYLLTGILQTLQALAFPFTNKIQLYFVQK